MNLLYPFTSKNFMFYPLQELSKNEKSLSQLEGRANSLIGKMTELWHLKTKFMEQFDQFTMEMEEAKVIKLLQPEANIKELQVCESIRTCLHGWYLCLKQTPAVFCCGKK